MDENGQTPQTKDQEVPISVFLMYWSREVLQAVDQMFKGLLLAKDESSKTEHSRAGYEAIETMLKDVKAKILLIEAAFAYGDLLRKIMDMPDKALAKALRIGKEEPNLQ